MNGNGGAIEVFDELDNPIVVAQPDDDGSGGWFEVRSIGDTLGFYVDGNYLGSGRARAVVRDQGGSNDIVLDASATEPDLTVRVPANSIQSGEISDEPGLASQLAVGEVVSLITSMQDVETVTIDVPADGYILLTGKCDLVASSHTTPNYAHVQIDEDAGGSSTAPYYSEIAWDALPTDSSYTFPVSVSRLYFKTAGTYTFRMEALKYHLGVNSISAHNPILTALYIPTSYGSVSTISPDPDNFSNAEPIQASSGEVVYKVDLRELEIRAKEARIRALEAEEALRKAQAQHGSSDSESD